MNVRTVLQTTIAVATLTLTASFIVAASGQGESRGVTFEITSATVDSGAGTSASAMYEITGTVGQPDAGPQLSSASFEVVGGFWMGGAEQSCPADIIGGNGVVDVFDLLELLANWGTDGNGANIAEPPNNIVDVFDLLDLLAAWGACE